MVPLEFDLGEEMQRSVRAEMMVLAAVVESQRLGAPVDLRVDLLEPRHAEDEVEAAERKGKEVQLCRVGQRQLIVLVLIV